MMNTISTILFFCSLCFISHAQELKDSSEIFIINTSFARVYSFKGIDHYSEMKKNSISLANRSYPIFPRECESQVDQIMQVSLSKETIKGLKGKSISLNIRFSGQGKVKSVMVEIPARFADQIILSKEELINLMVNIKNEIALELPERDKTGSDFYYSVPRNF